jgi:hypothetical protein
VKENVMTISQFTTDTPVSQRRVTASPGVRVYGFTREPTRKFMREASGSEPATRTLVAQFKGSSYVAEREGEELNIYLVTAGGIASATSGDPPVSTADRMTAARYPEARRGGAAVMDTRSALREARAKAAEADERLAVVRDRHKATQAYAAEIARKVEGLAAIDHTIACERADQIKAAIASGAVPLFDELPAVSATAAQMAEGQSQLSACRLALGEIEADERNAEADVAKAWDEARLEVNDVLLAEADAIAEHVQALEAEALIGRARLGGPLTPVGQLRGLSDAVVSVIASSQRLEPLFRDPKLTAEAHRASKVWAAFVEALGSDPDATLDFEQPATSDARAA